MMAPGRSTEECLTSLTRISAYGCCVRMHASVAVSAAAGRPWSQDPGAWCRLWSLLGVCSKKQPCLLRASGEAGPALVSECLRCPQPRGHEVLETAVPLSLATSPGRGSHHAFGHSPCCDLSPQAHLLDLPLGVSGPKRSPLPRAAAPGSRQVGPQPRAPHAPPRPSHP